MTFKEELEKDLQDTERAYREIHGNVIFLNEECSYFINYMTILKSILSVLID